jgi:phage N-6-adenine-methyltransferase
MKNRKVLASDMFETPVPLFEVMDGIFNFEWDVCATPENTKVPGCFFTEQDDALKQDWHRTARVFFMNPPFSKEAGKDLFIKKAFEESQKGCTTVAILPSKTDTDSYHTYIYDQLNVREIPLRGRPKFWLGGKPSENTGWSPIMVVVFLGQDEQGQMNLLDVLKAEELKAALKRYGTGRKSRKKELA